MVVTFFTDATGCRVYENDDLRSSTPDLRSLGEGGSTLNFNWGGEDAAPAGCVREMRGSGR